MDLAVKLCPKQAACKFLRQPVNLRPRPSKSTWSCGSRVLGRRWVTSTFSFSWKFAEFWLIDGSRLTPPIPPTPQRNGLQANGAPLVILEAGMPYLDSLQGL